MVSIRWRTKYTLLLILLLGIFLRFYRLPQTMQFLGDQGRDALTVRRMLIEHHPALIGPVTSVGNMYLGPFYYYFMLFPLMLTYPDPTGPAYAVALMGVVTVYLIYRLGKEMIGERAALFASFVFAISPLVLTFSRFSWNPNIVPFFSLMFIWHLYQALKGKDRAWIWVGLWFAILVQLHYITLILGGVAGLAWIYTLIQKIKTKKLKPVFFISTVIAVLIFLVSLTPLVAFDVRHDYTNYKAFLSFFKGTGGGHFSTNTSLFGRLVTNVGIFVRSFVGLFSYEAMSWVKVGVFGVLLGLMLWICLRKSAKSLGERLMALTSLVSVFGLSFYHGTIFDHYLSFLFPLVVMILGMCFAFLWQKAILRPIVLVLLVVFSIQAFRFYPGKAELGYNIYLMQRTAVEIQKHIVAGQKYNIFLFSPSNDYQGMNYRYFLTTGKQAPESESEFFNFSTLFVIQDIPQNGFEAGKHYMFAVWPNKKIVEQFDVTTGPRVYVMKR